MTVAFDTLKFVEILEQAQIPREQARAIVGVMRDAHDADEGASKADMHELENATDAEFGLLRKDMDLLRKDIAAVEQRLDAKIDGLEQRLDAKIDGLEQRLDAKIDGLEQRLDAKIDGLEQRLDAKTDGLRQRLDAKTDGLRQRLDAQIGLLRWMTGVTLAGVSTILVKLLWG